MQRLSGFDERLSEPVTLLDGALAQLAEAVSALRHYLDALEVDPARLRWLEDRVAAVMALARKHRVAPAEVAVLHGALRDELATLEEAGLPRAALEQAQRAAFADYEAAAAALTAARGAAAVRLDSEVSECIAGLGMPGAKFQAVLLPLDEVVVLMLVT